MRVRVLVICCIAVAGSACTGGAYQTGVVVSGASFGDVREVVRDAASALHLREDSASEGFFRTELEGVACGGVVVVIGAVASEVTIIVEQSCSPRWSGPKEYAALADQLRHKVEERFGKERVRGLARTFQPRG